MPETKPAHDPELDQPPTKPDPEKVEVQEVPEQTPPTDIDNPFGDCKSPDPGFDDFDF